MDYLTHKLLDEESATRIASDILENKSLWQDGKKTAGSHAAKVKNNVQLAKDSEIGKSSAQKIINLIRGDQLLKSFCLPKRIHGVMFSKTSIGQGYGTHVDNAYMSTGRSDLSFTLFLSNPNDYEGGELCIQSLQDHQEVKLSKGDLVIYPSTSLHSVNKVIAGERIVCLGWIESYITSNEDRNILFGLDAGARGLLAEHGQSQQLDLVFQAYNNLLRRLGS